MWQLESMYSRLMYSDVAIGTIVTKWPKERRPQIDVPPGSHLLPPLASLPPKELNWKVSYYLIDICTHSYYLTHDCTLVSY